MATDWAEVNPLATEVVVVVKASGEMERLQWEMQEAQPEI